MEPTHRRCHHVLVLLVCCVACAALTQLSGCRTAAPPRHTPIPSIWPLEGAVGLVTDHFRPGTARPHLGIDLAAPLGTPVVATADGSVRSAVRRPRYGRLLVLDHADGVQTRYAHLRRFVVREGQRVRAGQVIGTVGRSGNATGPHVHYEVRINGVPVDPAAYLPALRR